MSHDPGLYGGEIISEEYGVSGAGTPYWKVTCRITSRHQHDGRIAAYMEAVREVRYYVTDRSARILAEALEILGVTADQIDPGSASYSPLSGRHVTLRCAPGEYQGVSREEWRIARPPGAASTAAARIAAILAARARQTPPEGSSTSAGTPEPAPAT